MIKIYLNGNHYSTVNHMPSTIPGVKLSNLQSASEEQLLKHGITTEPYVAPEPIPPTAEEIAAQFKTACMTAIQSLLDSKSQEFGFESIHTAISWGSDRPQGAELKAWGKACWEKAELMQAEILAGTRPMPESVESLLTELPEWGAV